MTSGDIETLGAVHSCLFEEPYRSHIDPPLDFEDYHRFLLRYYERCWREDPAGPWSDSRYSAGWALVNWLVGLRDERPVREQAWQEWKAWLARQYREGDARLRTALVTATLEHVFEHRAMPGLFLDWKDDPVLGVAYREAMEWVQRGGRSPLGRGGDAR